MPVELFRHIARTHTTVNPTLYAPSPDLRHIVGNYFLYSNAAENQLREFAFADGQPGIGFMLDPPHTYYFSGRGTMETRQHAFLSGVLLEGVYIEKVAPMQRLFGIRFTSQGLYHLLREPLKTLRETVSSSLDDIFGARAGELIEAVLAQQTIEQRIDVLETFLRKHLRDGTDIDYVYDEAVRTIRDSGGQIRIDSLGVNYKWLERKCTMYMGITPKEYARLHRFLRAFFALHQDGRADGTSIALNNGYYDQTHFIREFRRFTAQTPREFLNNGVPDTAFKVKIRH